MVTSKKKKLNHLTFLVCNFVRLSFAPVVGVEVLVTSYLKSVWNETCSSNSRYCEQRH